MQSKIWYEKESIENAQVCPYCFKKHHITSETGFLRCKNCKAEYRRICDRETGKELLVWERAPQKKEVENKSHIKKVFICSRYAGDIELNIKIAKALCKKAISNGYAPFAPHLMYPQILNDYELEERLTGIKYGQEFLKVCDEVWVYDKDGISEGMKHDIYIAEAFDKPIRYIHSLIEKEKDYEKK